jgi:hypothetical protein
MRTVCKKDNECELGGSALPRSTHNIYKGKVFTGVAEWINLGWPEVKKDALAVLATLTADFIRSLPE